MKKAGKVLSDSFYISLIFILFLSLFQFLLAAFRYSDLLVNLKKVYELVKYIYIFMIPLWGASFLLIAVVKFYWLFNKDFFKKVLEHKRDAIFGTVALVISTAFFVVIYYFVSLKLLGSIAKEKNLAITLAIFAVVLFGLLFFVGVFLYSLVKRVLQNVDTKIVLGGGVLFVLVGVVVFVLMFYSTLSLLDLSPLWMISLAIVIALFLKRSLTYAHLNFFVILYGMQVFLLLGGGYGNIKSTLVKNETLLEIGYDSYKKIFDFDGDGFLNFLGEGDCAPFDKNINPGAIDIPDNGIDEDCFDGDLKVSLKKRVRKKHFLPKKLQKKYNFLLITVDALTPDHMSLYGYKRDTTPNIKKFAKKGVVFYKAFSQGPSTRLSIPAMFTSRYDSQIKRPHKNRIPLEILPQNLMLAEVLKDRGYETVSVLGEGYFKNWKGLLQGFSVKNFEVMTKVKRSKHKWTSKFMTEEAIKELKKLEKKGNPWFLWVHYYDPHQPYRSHRWPKSYGNKEVDNYDEEIRYTDEYIGRLLKYAVDLKDTVIIFTADHGESFDSKHRRFHHGYDLYTSIIHVPFIVWAPFLKKEPAHNENTLISLLDVFPTIVDIAGAKKNFNEEGESLVPVFLGKKDQVHEEIFHEFYLPENIKKKKNPLRMIAIRNLKYNLIYNLDTNTWELYDYVKDHFETHDLYDILSKETLELKRKLIYFRYRVFKGDIKKKGKRKH